MILPTPSNPIDDFSNVWYYLGKPIESIPEGAIGFVYCITNILTGRKYFGKKTCVFRKTRQKTVLLKNGNKKKKKIVEYVPSDYETYFGSNKEIHSEIEATGEHIFFREILVWCESPAEMSYIEAKYQFAHDVILSPNLYYNQYIMCRIAPTHVKSLIERETK